MKWKSWLKKGFTTTCIFSAWAGSIYGPVAKVI